MTAPPEGANAAYALAPLLAFNHASNLDAIALLAGPLATLLVSSMCRVAWRPSRFRCLPAVTLGPGLPVVSSTRLKVRC